MDLFGGHSSPYQILQGQQAVSRKTFVSKIPLAEGPVSIHASVPELNKFGESDSGSSDTQDIVE